MTVLSVLDQSPVRAGCTPADALREPLVLAVLCDRLGSHRHRLAGQGFSDTELAGINCPIGLPGIVGKEPAVIAASVVAQLLLDFAPAPAATACVPLPSRQCRH